MFTAKQVVWLSGFAVTVGELLYAWVLVLVTVSNPATSGSYCRVSGVPMR